MSDPKSSGCGGTGGARGRPLPRRGMPTSASTPTNVTGVLAVLKRYGPQLRHNRHLFQPTPQIPNVSFLPALQLFRGPKTACRHDRFLVLCLAEDDSTELCWAADGPFPSSMPIVRRLKPALKLTQVSKPRPPRQLVQFFEETPSFKPDDDPAAVEDHLQHLLKGAL